MDALMQAAPQTPPQTLRPPIPAPLLLPHASALAAHMPRCGIHDLTDDLLLNIFWHLAEGTAPIARVVLPLVCHRWAAVLRRPSELWSLLEVDLSPIQRRDTIFSRAQEWVRPRAEAINHMTLSLGMGWGDACVDRLLPLLPTLESLELRTDNYRSESVFAGGFPAVLLCLTRLRSLTLESDAVNCIPEGITALSRLTLLDVQRCRIEEPLPASLPRLPRLARLGLRTKDTGRVDAELRADLAVLQACPALSALALRSETAVQIPITIAQLTGLRALALSSWRLQWTPLVPAMQAGPPLLERLALEECHLEAVPKAVCTLGGLRDLRLNRNQLRELPASMALLPCLRKLDLSHNRFQEFPLIVGCLTGLTELSLRGNALSDVPYGAAQLRALQRLDLSGNPFRELPAQLQRLTALEVLDMRDCRALRIEQPLFWMANMPRLRRVRLARYEDPRSDPLLPASAVAGAGRTKLGWRPPATKQLRRIARAMPGTTFEI